MTDQPEFRLWADRAHRSLMQPYRTKKRKTKYKCVNPACKHGNSLNQAIAHNGDCKKCGSPLISKNKILNERVL